MASEIICALITAGGTVLSILISFFVSRSTANSEIAKMRLTWEREDSLASGKELEELARLIYDYTSSENDYLRIPAMAKLTSIRARETSEVSALLDKLHLALSHGNKLNSEQVLSEIVIQLRKTKSERKRKHCKQPS